MADYITKKTKPTYITKKEHKKEYITKKPEKKAWITKKLRTGVPHFNTGGRATHGYGKAYMKGGKVK